MSQYQNQDMYAYDESMVDGPRTSGMAITSLVMSLIGIIPCLGLITAPIGALLGLIGLVTISPPRKGKGLAAAGLILGVVFLGGQLYGGKLVYDFFGQFIEVVMKGPREALEDGFGGNYGTFKTAFHGPGAAVTDAEAKAFIDELRNRYGNFQGVAFDEASGGPQQPPPGQAQVVFPYVITFANATVDADVEIIFADPQQQQAGFILKLGYILIKDPDLGDLRYPPAGSGAAPSGDAPADPDPDADAGGEGGSGTP